jgi:hypothetical protein
VSEKSQDQITINISIILEVLAVLSPQEPKDALDILQETKKVIRKKIDQKANDFAANNPGFIAVQKEGSLDAALHYDLILEALRRLVTSGKAKMQMGKNNTPQFLRY